MKKWVVRDSRCLNSTVGGYEISGVNLNAAIEYDLKRIAWTAADKEHCNVMEVRGFRTEWSDGIFGGQGGIRVLISARVNNQNAKTSPDYKEKECELEAWIYGKKEDLEEAV